MKQPDYNVFINVFGDSELIVQIINSGWLFQSLRINVLLV